MKHLPVYIYFIFGFASLLASAIFYRASQHSKKFLFITLIWLFILSFLSLSDNYSPTKSLLPIFPVLIIPPILLMIILLITTRGKKFIRRLNIKTLMMLHSVRILAELGLFWLAVYQVVPKSLTFEGRNYDILIGVSAPAVYYFGYVKSKLRNSTILLWNFIGLASLFNVIFNTGYAVLVLKQPDFALGYFPFFLLPALIVPLIMFSHLASIKQILSK